jgi:hypothetical protein
MATDNILRTYGDVSMEPDVLSDIEILTATEDMIHNTLGKTKAISTVHENMTDTLATVGSLAVGQAEDYTSKALTTPSRILNLVQKNTLEFKVSRTQQEVAHFQGQDELTRQLNKALKEWMNGTEFDLVRGSMVSAGSGTADRMAGIINQISKSTNTTAQTSGTAFSASILRGLMKANWDNSNGDVVTDIYLGSFLSNEMDSFANKTTTVNSGVNVKEIINAVEVFETGLGRVRRHIHRYIQDANDATGRILGINPDKFKVAYLKRTYIDTGLARNGGYDRRAVDGELTLEVRNKDCAFFATGYDKD